MHPIPNNMLNSLEPSALCLHVHAVIRMLILPVYQLVTKVVLASCHTFTKHLIAIGDGSSFELDRHSWESLDQGVIMRGDSSAFGSTRSQVSRGIDIFSPGSFWRPCLHPLLVCFEAFLVAHSKLLRAHQKGPLIVGDEFQIRMSSEFRLIVTVLPIAIEEAYAKVLAVDEFMICWRNRSGRSNESRKLQ
jgi:hypothetical protein